MSDSLRISIENKINESDQSIDLTQTTPVIRPWYNVRQQSTDLPEAEQSNPSEAEDYDEDVYNSSDYDMRGLPATPSRLLTITSTDFGDDRGHRFDGNDDDAIMSGNEERSASYSQHDQDNYEMDFDQILDSQDVDRDIRNHDDIITEHMNKLNLAAQAHFSQVIQRLLKEKNNSIRSRDEFFAQQMQKQQGVIDDLNTVLTRTEDRYEREIARSDRYCMQLAVKHIHMQRLYSSEFSLSRVLQCWKSLVRERRCEVRNTFLAERAYKRRLLTTAFSALNRESTERRLERKQYDSKSHFEVTMKEMVVQYESEVTSLQIELQEAQQVIRQERLRRQQLEEDLRRMFLKNMTTMNMEALSLFQDPQTLPPQMAEFGPGVVLQREELAQRQIEEQQNMLRNQMKTQQKILQERQQRQNDLTFNSTTRASDSHESSRLIRLQHQQLAGDDENSGTSRGARVAPDGSKVIRVGTSKTIVTQNFQQRSAHRQEVVSSHISAGGGRGSKIGNGGPRVGSKDGSRQDEDGDCPQPRAPLRNMSTGQVAR